MIDAIQKVVAPLQRRIMLAVGRAILNAVYDGGKVQLVQASMLADEVRDKMERMAEYGFTSVPLPGAQAVAVFVGGERGHGVVVATGDPRCRMSGLDPGEVALYDDQGQSVHLTRAGIVIKGAGKPIIITDAPKARFEMDIEATGNITDNVDSGGRSMQGMRDVFNGHDHDENDSGGPTDKPNQQM